MPFISSIRGSYGPQGRFGKRKSFADSTGGSITTVGGYRIHTFLLGQSGTSFTPGDSGTVEYLVVGGGGGSRWDDTGGGGAGGYRTGSLSVTSETPYTITVGAGSAGTPENGDRSLIVNGGNSVFSSITSLGGGWGAEQGVNGNPGGSGGGGGHDPSTGGSGTAGQGRNGGQHTGAGGSGGGGAGAVGTSGNSTGGGSGGAGGAGATSSTTVGGSAGPYAFINDMGAATSTGQLSGGNY